MKDCEPMSGLTIAEEAEKFHESFVSNQDNLNKMIADAETINQEDLHAHFSLLNTMLQNLHRQYSASSPYLKIYYRKIYQDSLQSLQLKIQEAESKLLPRKKFGFKNKRMKTITSVSSSINKHNLIKTEDKKQDVYDGIESCSVQNKNDATIVLTASSVSGTYIMVMGSPFL